MITERTFLKSKHPPGSEPAQAYSTSNPTSPLPEKRELAQVWLVAAIAGDVVAFGELYQLHADQIYKYCAYRVSNPTEAEDLTAQVFLKAWQAIPRYEISGAPFLAWLYRIAHGLVVDYHKSRCRQTEVADAGLDEQFLESIGDDHSEGSNPFDKLFRQTRREAVRRALVYLPEDQQQVIYFRFVEERSHAEIAAMLDKKEGTVRGIQYRALETLGKVLGREGFLE